MKMLFLIIVTLVLIILALVFILATLQTFRTQTSPNQKIFLSGTLPKNLPDGLYKGEVPGHKFTWVGKKFDSKTGMGINIFNNGKTTEAYPFKFYKSSGLQDNIQVVRIDYNLPENPIWLRFIVDEIVETSPNKFLGKLHIKILPGIVASLGYFTLEK